MYQAIFFQTFSKGQAHHQLYPTKIEIRLRWGYRTNLQKTSKTQFFQKISKPTILKSIKSWQNCTIHTEFHFLFFFVQFRLVLPEICGFLTITSHNFARRQLSFPPIFSHIFLPANTKKQPIFGFYCLTTHKLSLCSQFCSFSCNSHYF